MSASNLSPGACSGVLTTLRSWIGQGAMVTGTVPSESLAVTELLCHSQLKISKVKTRAYGTSRESEAGGCIRTGE